MATEAQVLAAVLTKINAALPDGVEAYEPDDVPKKHSDKPDEFVVVTIVRRPGGNPKAGRYSITGWSVTLMAASSSAVSNARNSLRIAGDAIEGKELSVDDQKSTPVSFATGRPVAEDDGWFTGVRTYQCAV